MSSPLDFIRRGRSPEERRLYKAFRSTHKRHDKMLRRLLREVGQLEWGSDMLSTAHYEVLSVKSMEELRRRITPQDRVIFPQAKGKPLLELPEGPIYGWVVGEKTSFLSWALGEVRLDAFFAVFLTGAEPRGQNSLRLEPTRFLVLHHGGKVTTEGFEVGELRRALVTARRAGPVVVEDILE